MLEQVIIHHGEPLMLSLMSGGKTVSSQFVAEMLTLFTSSTDTQNTIITYKTENVVYLKVAWFDTGQMQFKMTKASLSLLVGNLTSKHISVMLSPESIILSIAALFAAFPVHFLNCNVFLISSNRGGWMGSLFP